MHAEKERIVIVEDDAKLAALIGEFLQSQGLQIDLIEDGAKAVDSILAHPPALVVLDLMLPGEDGLSICRRLRAAGFARPILMLTARSDDQDHIKGLDLGADDFVNKPVRPQVLLARIRALLRRTEAEAPQIPVTRLSFGALVIDNTRREAWLANELIDLTGAEFDLLWLLASNAGRILSREETFVALRGIEYDGQDRSIDVRISRIRPKIGDDPDMPRLIKTVRSKGYLFVAPELDLP
ncbi:two-component system, OmpR family, response regulator RstA [Halopseudomonas litoralis]|uniref:Two-component system, OmpR family, response regulator RstA n=1 Tax=Halopseudomonas litoralis TaxID=797277 RepID=A0A1H1SGS0_9GAMM|nr:response regulator transcription factor [Halopseudomonas litoralis]SDS46569.1 two-component system, OmpR family, response regulator RstA [Halopseudomonas litoralis]